MIGSIIKNYYSTLLFNYLQQCIIFCIVVNKQYFQENYGDQAIIIAMYLRDIYRRVTSSGRVKRKEESFIQDTKQLDNICESLIEENVNLYVLPIFKQNYNRISE